MSASQHAHHGQPPAPVRTVAGLRLRRNEQRLEPRLKLPVMYTLIRVRPAGEPHYRWTGHIYDISLSGMRFEIDEPLEPGTAIEIRAMLPGQRHTLFRAAGHIVRLHDDEPDPMPVRLAMRFDDFASTIDRHRLNTYLSDTGLRRRTAARRPAA